jgi:hypothetical protein
MQSVARGVGLSGLAPLVLACAMAAPAARGNVPRPQVQLPNVHIGKTTPPAGGGIKTFKPNAAPGSKTIKGSLVHTQKGLKQNKSLQQKYIPNTPTGGGTAGVGGIDVTKQVNPANTPIPGGDTNPGGGGTFEGSGGTLELGGGTTGVGIAAPGAVLNETQSGNTVGGTTGGGIASPGAGLGGSIAAPDAVFNETQRGQTVSGGDVYGGGNMTLQAPAGGAGNLGGSVPPPTK